MKKSDIYEIAIKILGLYLFMTSIGFLREVISYFVVINQAKQYQDSFGGFDQMPLFLVSAGNFVLVTVFAFFLTFKSKSIVKIICDKSDYSEKASLFADKKVIYEIALTLLGLIIIVWTLPEFAFNLKNHIYLVNNNFPTKISETNLLIVSAIKIIVALLAVFYSKPISNFIAKDSKHNKDK